MGRHSAVFACCFRISTSYEFRMWVYGTLRDERVLEFAAFHDRIVLSHDVTTMKGHAEERLRLGQAMPGLFLVRQDIPIGRVIEEIVMVAECSDPAEWIGEIRFLPLR